MNKILIKDLKDHFNEEIEIGGFVENIRDLQYVQFVILKDSTGKIQLTLEKSEEKNKEMIELFKTLTLESTITVKGIVMENPKVKLNGMELIPSEVKVTSVSSEELPFNYHDLDNVNLDTRLDYRMIDLRNEKNMLTFQIQSNLVRY